MFDGLLRDLFGFVISAVCVLGLALYIGWKLSHYILPYLIPIAILAVAALVLYHAVPKLLKGPAL